MTDDLFDEFWARYPKKVAKIDAQKAWRQMTREYEPAEIIAGLDRNLPSLNAKERQFVKHPASWLRAGCWMDEPEPQSTGNALVDAMMQERRH